MSTRSDAAAKAEAAKNADANQPEATLDPEAAKAAAQLLGMKQREVLDVVEADGGIYIQTHDRTWTFVNADREMTFNVDAPAKRRN